MIIFVETNQSMIQVQVKNMLGMKTQFSLQLNHANPRDFSVDLHPLYIKNVS